MKRQFRMGGVALVAAIALLAASSYAQGPAETSAAVKMAVIDVNRVVTDSVMGKEIFAKLKRLQESKIEEGKRKEKELKELEQKVADQKFTLAEEKIAALQKEYQQKAIDFKRFQDDADRELDEAQKRELRELEKKIMPVINALGREERYTMIFNKFQSGLVYADDAIDITDAVVRRFNAIAATPAEPKAPGSAEKKEAAPEPAKKK